MLQSTQPRPHPQEEAILEHVRQASLSNGVRLSLVHGDLTHVQLDAIVNAANASLKHGGGVAGAIVRGGGMVIQRESDAWVRAHGPVRHDSPALTVAGDLPCRHVIHAVGPIWGEGEEDQKLSTAVRSALQLAEDQGFRGLALPAISTGIFGFPKDRAARVIFSSLDNYAGETPSPALKQIWVVIWDEPTLEIFSGAFENRWPGTGGDE
jgi:O-acetyl-ADP-ribose deacetylase (regulator of RNase III)